MPECISRSRCNPRRTHFGATSSRVTRSCSGDRVYHSVAIIGATNSARKRLSFDPGTRLPMSRTLSFIEAAAKFLDRGVFRLRLHVDREMPVYPFCAKGYGIDVVRVRTWV